MSNRKEVHMSKNEKPSKPVRCNSQLYPGLSGRCVRNFGHEGSCCLEEKPVIKTDIKQVIGGFDGINVPPRQEVQIGNKEWQVAHEAAIAEYERVAKLFSAEVEKTEQLTRKLKFLEDKYMALLYERA